MNSYDLEQLRHCCRDAAAFEQMKQILSGIAEQQVKLLEQTQRQSVDLAQALEELQRSHTHLIQSEKMSSLGQLVAGVAHEINNPVNFIYGNLSHASQYAQDLLEILALYQQEHPQPSPQLRALITELDLEFLMEDFPRMLASMHMGADRIRQIVLSLRNFSRWDEAEMKPVDIHEGIDSTLLILQHRLKPHATSAGIQVIKSYGNLPPVECYVNQLNQVFMNILSNAIDALEDVQKQREDSSDRTPLEQKIVIQTELNSNPETGTPQVIVRIKDNGSGIPVAVQAKLFDPFFTTKPVGKGTGLGLSISYQIVVERHGGNLSCNSRPGEGTEFCIEIPLQQPSSASEQPLPCRMEA